MATLNKQLDRNTVSSAGRAGTALSGLARPAKIGMIGMAAAAALSFKAAAEFERSINVFGAVTDATGPKMEQARKLAIKLGQDVWRGTAWARAMPPTA